MDLYSKDLKQTVIRSLDAKLVPPGFSVTTDIDIEDGRCSLDLLEEISEYIALTLAQALTVIREVASLTANWLHPAEINHMATPSSITI